MQKIFKDLLIYMDQMIDGYTIDEQETLTSWQSSLRTH